MPEPSTKRKAGRPRVPGSKIRSIHFRVNEEEYVRIRFFAQQDGVDLSEYLRARALKEEIVPIDETLLADGGKKFLTLAREGGWRGFRVPASRPAPKDLRSRIEISGCPRVRLAPREGAAGKEVSLDPYLPGVLKGRMSLEEAVNSAGDYLLEQISAGEHRAG